MTVCQIVTAVVNAIINPLIALIFAVGLVVFAWGIIEFLWNLSGGGEGIEKGKKHMIWGVVGMAIMLSAYTIITIIVNTFGIGGFPTC